MKIYKCKLCGNALGKTIDPVRRERQPWYCSCCGGYPDPDEVVELENPSLIHLRELLVTALEKWNYANRHSGYGKAYCYCGLGSEDET